MDQKSGERLAIFDLGTNTFNLLVRDAEGSLLRSEKLPVKLGAGGLRSDEISPDAEERAIAAMHQHKAWAQEAGASRGYAFATSAMRSTRNGAEVAARIERETGIPVNIIDGDQEAAFIAGGVAHAWPERSEPRLIMDIGGGSTEFILLDGTDVLYAESFPLGVTRLVERFQPADPMSPEDAAQQAAQAIERGKAARVAQEEKRAANAAAMAAKLASSDAPTAAAAPVAASPTPTPPRSAAPAASPARSIQPTPPRSPAAAAAPAPTTRETPASRQADIDAVSALP